MQYAVCCVPVSAMRRDPSHAAEMVSQQLFGECCIILEDVNGWTKVHGKYDAYEGWCQPGHLIPIDKNQYSSKNEKLGADHLNKVGYNREKMLVPLGSSLATFKKNKALWKDVCCTYKGETYVPDEKNISKKTIKYISRKYLNTPYLWGGKSVFGIDCSGFSQSVYKFLNVYLPRDSSQQAQTGAIVSGLDKARCGDLCFFDNKEGKIVHVGVLLSKQKIIHSSGKVRIDLIDDKGIINGDTNEYTHALKLIKRYFRLRH